jgi:hypothetical protein
VRIITFVGAMVLLAGALTIPVRGDDAQQILTIDHYVGVQSTVPSLAGQRAQIYVRERTRGGDAGARRLARQSGRAVRARCWNSGIGGV